LVIGNIKLEPIRKYSNCKLISICIQLSEDMSKDDRRPKEYTGRSLKNIALEKLTN
jgi:hypothetical protein